MTEKLLKIQEVGDLLNISRATIYRLVREGHLPTVQIGRSRRVKLGDLDLFVDALNSTIDLGSEG